VAIAALASLLAAQQALPAAHPFGAPLRERALLAPRAGTFYAKDVLNPDVVRWRNRYYMFFSGNRTPTDAGDWRTGVAVSRSPLSGFHVLPKMQAPFLNGGTRVDQGLFRQVATPSTWGPPVVYQSRNLSRWAPVAEMPVGAPGSWNAEENDPSFGPAGRNIFFAARPGPGGADLGSRRYLGYNRWGEAQMVLRRGKPGNWDAADLGEPSVFNVGKRRFMLYSALAQSGGVRQIGLARKTAGGWKRVGDKPLIAAGGGPGWHGKNAIDPSSLVVGNKLYVYFAGGKTTSQGGNMSGTIGARVYNLTVLLARR